MFKSEKKIKNRKKNPVCVSELFRNKITFKNGISVTIMTMSRAIYWTSSVAMLFVQFCYRPSELTNRQCVE